MHLGDGGGEADCLEVWGSVPSSGQKCGVMSEGLSRPKPRRGYREEPLTEFVTPGKPAFRVSLSFSRCSCLSRQAAGV